MIFVLLFFLFLFIKLIRVLDKIRVKKNNVYGGNNG